MTIDIRSVNTCEDVRLCYQRLYDMLGVIMADDISNLTKDQGLMIERMNVMLNSKAGEPRIGVSVAMNTDKLRVSNIMMWVECTNKL